MVARGAGEGRQTAFAGALERRPRRRSAWRALLEPEKLAAVAVLFWMSGPVAPLIPDLDSSLDTMMSLSGNSSSTPGFDNQFLRLSWYPVYVIVLLLAHRHWHRISHVAKRNWLVLLLLGWTLLSTLWSVSPADTLRRSVALSLTTTFAFYLGGRFDTLTVVKLLALAFGIDVVGGALCAVAFPKIGICHDADYPGAWRGLFASKNQLGAMMLIECLSVSVLYFAERRRVYLIGLVASFGLLVLSTSKTPLFILLSLVPCLWLVRRFFRTPRGFATLLALSLCVAAIVFVVGSVTIGAILDFFGRDETLTGRTDIWSLSWDAIQQRYWMGYGYGAFWSNPWGPATNIWDALSWRVPSSHSGLLELWLGLGLVGVVTFGALLVRSISEILSQAAQGTCEECLWRLGYFLIFVVHAVTEPTAMDQTSVSWAVFIAVVVGGGRVARDARNAATVRAARLAAAPWAADVAPYMAAAATGGARLSLSPWRLDAPEIAPPPGNRREIERTQR